MEDISIEDLKNALSSLPEEVQQSLQTEPVIDTIGIKMELIKFVSELHKHNQGVDWETNKQKPQNITVERVIESSKKLFEFITE
jgi:hypothetical protein